MNLEDKLIDELEDDYVLFVAGLRNGCCTGVAREHSASLQQRSLVALIAGYLDDALWYAGREADFNLRAFGARSRATILSQRHVEALREYERAMMKQASEQAA